MFDYRALYEIQLQVSVDFLRVVQYDWNFGVDYLYDKKWLNHLQAHDSHLPLQ